MAEKPLGWGIIGLGRIVRTQIAPAIEASADSTLISVVSRDQGRAQEFARTHSAARAYDDYQKMLTDPDVEAVYVATPNAQHADQVVAAARAGKHVLCDKPLATSAADARRAVGECRAAGVRLGVTFQTRFHAGMAEAARVVREGGIGRVVIAQAQMSAGLHLPVSWRTDPALAGLGTINNLGVHGLDILRYLVGSEVDEVTALTDSEPGYAVDTTALILLRFANGTLGYVNANQSVSDPEDDIVLYGTLGRFVARNLARPGRDGEVSFAVASGATSRAGSSHDAYLRTIEEFAAAVRDGREPSPSGEDGLRSVELTDAIAEALRTGRVVHLPVPAPASASSLGSGPGSGPASDPGSGPG